MVKTFIVLCVYNFINISKGNILSFYQYKITYQAKFYTLDLGFFN